MEKVDKNSKNIDLIDFINQSDNIISQQLTSTSLVSFLSPVFELISSLVSNDYSAFFLMDNKSFKFEYIDSTIGIEKNNIIQIFNNQIDNGLIADVIEKEEIIISDDKQVNNSNGTFLLLPLFKFQGVLGVFLIKLTDKNISNIINQRLNLLSKIIASKLEIFLLENENKSIVSLLEQKIAVRTLNLINSKRELEIVLNAVQTAILVIEPESNIIIHANPEAIRLIGTNEKNILNEDPSLFLEFPQNDNQVAFSRNYESILTNINKDKIPILRSSTKIKYETEYIIIESFVDITHIKEIERELNLVNDRLEQKVKDRTEELKDMVNKLEVEVEERKKAEAEIKILLEKEQEYNELKSRVITLISHEFRTPLTIINTSAQIVQNYKDKISDKEQNQYLSRIQKTVQDMSSLLENILFLNKSGVLGLENNPQEVDIVSITEGIINDIKLSSNENLDIQFHSNSDRRTVFLAARLYRSILINLLSNAVKYSDSNKIIQVNLSCENNQINLSVRDHGIGIPDEDKDKIFNEFYRAGNTSNISGTGLGLSVISSSLKAIGGKIEFISQVNTGTTFTVTFPNNPQREQ